MLTRLVSDSAVSAGIVAMALWFAAVPARGFSLMGPYGDWAATTNSYRRGLDVGGPVDITQGYRWNVPVVTYGFDPAFLAYFGSNGVSAVDQAISFFNDLPPASAMVLTNFATDWIGENYLANSEGLVDLKSSAMAILIEQLGLAEPERSVFVLHKWDASIAFTDEEWWPTGTVPEFIWYRNFDPISCAPSHWVNGNLYTGYVFGYSRPTTFVLPQLVDPVGRDFSAVADWRYYLRPLDISSYLSGGMDGVSGFFCRTITYDDAGGLRYLLSTTNVQLEALLPGVHGAGTNAGNYVDLALRPGIDKISFIRHPTDAAGMPLAYTNIYVDTYISNGVPLQQQLERIVAQPDFLFSAADLGATNVTLVPVVRSGTENWWNSTPPIKGAVGPGVIRPPVKITFSALSPMIETQDSPGYPWDPTSYDFQWGSFDNSTNNVAPISLVLPNADTNKMQVHLVLLQSSDGSIVAGPNWQAPVRVGQGALFETSTNLVVWQSQVVATNRGGTIIWRHWFSLPQGFFRVVPL